MAALTAEFSLWFVRDKLIGADIGNKLMMSQSGVCVCHLTSVPDLQPPLAAHVTGGRAHVLQHVVEQEVLVLVALLRVPVEIQLIGRAVPRQLRFPSVVSPAPAMGGAPQVGEGREWAVPQKQVAADGGFQAAGELTEFAAIDLHQERLHQPPSQPLHLPTVEAGAHSPAPHLQRHGADVTVTLLRRHRRSDVTEEAAEETRATRFLRNTQTCVETSSRVLVSWRTRRTRIVPDCSG